MNLAGAEGPSGCGKGICDRVKRHWCGRGRGCREYRISTSQGYMVGDYIATAIGAHRAWGVFAVARVPKGGLFDEAMYTVTGGLPLSGGSIINSDLAIASAPSSATSAEHRR